ARAKLTRLSRGFVNRNGSAKCGVPTDEHCHLVSANFAVGRDGRIQNDKANIRTRCERISGKRLLTPPDAVGRPVRAGSERNVVKKTALSFHASPSRRTSSTQQRGRPASKGKARSRVMSSTPLAWPPLVFAGGQESCVTLQLWTQVVGKVRRALAPMANHWWQVPLYVTARGLTTSPMPYAGGALQIDFDFIDHRLVIATSAGRQSVLALEPRSVADFHRALMSQLAALGVAVKIWTMPVEIPNAIPFESDD